MDREHLEAVIWRQWPHAPAAAVDAILAAAERYALDTYGITAERRAVLAGDDSAYPLAPGPRGQVAA